MYMRAWGMVRSLVLMGVLATVPVVAFAQEDIKPLNIQNVSGIINIIKTLTQWFFELILIISVVMILVAAYGYLTAQGDAEKVSKAHKTLTWATIGIVVALLATGVPYIVKSLFSNTGQPASSTPYKSSLPPGGNPNWGNE